MAKIEKSVIQRILDATNIVDVIGEFIELKPKQHGARYIGLCPFHDDRHATNFVVYPKMRCYRCFACGAKGDAVKFLTDHAKLSFVDAIRWLGKKVGIDVDDHAVVLATKTYTPPPPLPTLFLSTAAVRARENTDNMLCTWLKNLPWSPSQRERLDEVLAEYHIGTSKWGHTIFWQIDNTGGVRDGKMMDYLSDGHRNKNNPYGISWVSRALFNAGRIDEEKYEVRRCLFGLHLLNRYPTAEVRIVESEKTAIFCATYYGEPEKRIWLATAGKSNLTKHLLQPVIDARRIIALYPDKDAGDDWERRRKEIGYGKMYVNNAVMTLQWREKDGPKADIADVLERTMCEARRSRTVQKLAEIMPSVAPAVKMMIDKLDLEEWKNTKQ